MIGGVGSAVVIGAIFFANWRSSKKNQEAEHEEEGEEILRTMQEAEAPDPGTDLAEADVSGKREDPEDSSVTITI